MATTFKTQLSEIMNLAWQMVKRNGYTMSEALKIAWMNMKLKMQMKKKIVRFYYRKVSGEVREAFGSLQESLLPETKESGRKPNDTLFTYYDTERESWRSFKRANLLSIGDLN
ncbi:SH3 beta-barrel fold-containing protein [Bacteroides fragilis]|uniref:SH3 beta-barrel fold-containing protein n=1 Tax=Bacteroides fragilis TaxID=817 RepID=UPI002030F25A|nr:SH3 beta-barrel fold-containing protein [Bacteroides fragilis]MCM0314250.1 DUF2693 domain-containing protein [Bacteroides fragilis]